MLIKNLVRLGAGIILLVTALIAMGKFSKAEEFDTVKEREKFTIALIPEKNIFEQRRRYRPLINYIGRNLNLDIELKFLTSYTEIYQDFIDGKVDAAFLGSFTYVQARALAGVEPIARPVWLEGSSTYSGYLFVRKDSSIRNVEDMKGRRLVLVNGATTAGYIFPLDYFIKQGVRDINSFFKEVIFAGSHDYACWAVYIKEADVGAAKNHIFNNLAEKYPKFKESMLILAESLEVPSNGLAVRKDINTSLKLKLKELLLNLHRSDEGRIVLNAFGAVKFIETTDQDYSPLYDMLERLKIDLKHPLMRLKN